MAAGENAELLQDDSRAIFLRLRAGFVVMKGEEPGKEVYFSKESIIIGRAAECDIRVPDSTVSRQHAAVLLQKGKFVIKDLSSTNGTIVNDVPVPEKELEPGDLVTIGSFIFRYVQDEKPKFKQELWAFEAQAKKAAKEAEGLRAEVEALKAQLSASPAALAVQAADGVPNAEPADADRMQRLQEELDMQRERAGELEKARASSLQEIQEARTERARLLKELNAAKAELGRAASRKGPDTAELERKIEEGARALERAERARQTALADAEAESKAGAELAAKLDALASDRDANRSDWTNEKRELERKLGAVTDLQARLAVADETSTGMARELDELRKKAASAVQSSGASAKELEETAARADLAEKAVLERHAEVERRVRLHDASLRKWAERYVGAERKMREMQDDYDVVLGERDARLQQIGEIAKIQADAIVAVHDEFAASLKVIKEHIEEVVKISGGRPDDAQSRFIERILSTVAPLERLLFDLISFSRLAFGLDALTHDQISLSDLVDEMTTKVHGTVERRRLQLVVKKVPGKCMIWGDHERLREVLGALVRNAVKFTPEGGRVEVELSEHPNEYRVGVLETGTKIMTPRPDSFFLSFEGAVSGLQKKIGNGTGLRMPIMQSIIESHVGRMWFESAEGVGNRFLFALPKA